VQLLKLFTMTEPMDDKVKSFCSCIDYTFIDQGILKEALTPPFANKQVSDNPMIDFKRLKWLGSTVLDMVVTDTLYNSFPNDTEGNLSSKKYRLVESGVLLKVADDIKIEQFIYFHPNERLTPTKKNISDTIEAIIGAIYLDGGMKKAGHFINKYWEPLIFDSIGREESDWNPKTYLTSWMDKIKSPRPKYEVVGVKGTAINPTYKVKMSMEKFGESFGLGSTKKEAEKRAAEEMYKRLFKMHEEPHSEGSFWDTEDLSE
jgi:ribonuclease-3